MNIQTLLDQITDYADALEIAAKWHNSKESIAKVKHKQTVANGGDYIYEFYCYIRVLSDLTHNYTVEFRMGSGKTKMNFPQGPSNKKGKPFFMLKDKSSDLELFQVCAGTEISTMFPPMTAAPDISFQKADASVNPDYTEVLLIFDAKFNRENSAKSKVSQGQLGEVASMISGLMLNRTPSVSLLFHELTGFTKNCLLTNGKAHFSNPSYHQYHNMLEVENFTINETYSIID